VNQKNITVKNWKTRQGHRPDTHCAAPAPGIEIAANGPRSLQFRRQGRGIVLTHRVLGPHLASKLQRTAPVRCNFDLTSLPGANKHI